MMEGVENNLEREPERTGEDEVIEVDALLVLKKRKPD